MKNMHVKIHSVIDNAKTFIYVNEVSMPHGGEDILKVLAGKNIKISLVEVLVEGWNRMLSPWKAEPVRKTDSPFEGLGRETLDYIENVVYKEVVNFPGSNEIYLTGYSLAGLFCLWSLYESNMFDGAVCCSSSLWYPGWDEYSKEHKLQKESNIYLSLGQKESKTANETMASVEKSTRQEFEKLKLDGKCKTIEFVMNPGGHFTEPVRRIASGIEWIAGNKAIF